MKVFKHFKQVNASIELKVKYILKNFDSSGPQSYNAIIRVLQPFVRISEIYFFESLVHWGMVFTQGICLYYKI